MDSMTPENVVRLDLSALCSSLIERVQALEIRLDNEQPLSRVTCRLVIELVALETGVAQRLILSPIRERGVTNARHLAMWLCRQVTGQSVSGIGRAFDRDHTTVLSACHKAEQLRAEEPAFFKRSERLRNLFLGGSQ